MPLRTIVNTPQIEEWKDRLASMKAHNYAVPDADREIVRMMQAQIDHWDLHKTRVLTDEEVEAGSRALGVHVATARELYKYEGRVPYFHPSLQTGTKWS